MREQWTDEAACRADPDLMFDNIEGSRGRPVKDTAGLDPARFARAVCADCPVLSECSEWTLTLPYHEPYGVLAGMTPSERKKLREGARQTTRVLYLNHGLLSYAQKRKRH